MDRDGEGSTGPSRGEHPLTVYRAHASPKKKSRIPRFFEIFRLFGDFDDKCSAASQNDGRASGVIFMKKGLYESARAVNKG